ncbi:MAG TPA: glycosyltransferase family 4 protein [Candidatus Sulfotelmatobacter sp.]|nr:glycosyltransferase family 4 protein [Candidatus Sulfotelmatobacter sp.]
MARGQLVLIAPPWYPVPPEGYGGIELVVALLAGGLRQLDQDVLIFGAEGSAPEVEVEAPSHWRADLGHKDERLRELTYAAHIRRALARRADSVDVIHDHTGFATLLTSSLIPLVPVVHTVHGPVSEPLRTSYQSLGTRVGLVAISDSQRSTVPELNWLGTVHNAVDIDQLTVAEAREKEGYLLCLARICRDKGQHLAVEVARRTGRKLVLAGKIEPGPEGHEYFAEYIAPAIDGDKVVHISDVSGKEKASLLAKAAALLAPLQWEEPFGLYMAEAVASGTPVIALSRGAAPEVVAHGETGFLVENVDEMVEAVSRLDEIDAARCAKVGRDRFSPRTMAAGYLEIYEKVLTGIDELLASRPGTEGAVATARSTAASAHETVAAANERVAAADSES